MQRNGIGWCSGAMWCMSHPQNYIIHCLIDHIDYMTILYYTILDVITVQWPSSISDSCVGSLSACHILSPRFWLIGPLSVFASGGCIAVNGSSLGPTSVTRLSSDAWEILSQMALFCLGNLEFAVRKASQAEPMKPLCHFVPNRRSWKKCLVPQCCPEVEWIPTYFPCRVFFLPPAMCQAWAQP